MNKKIGVIIFLLIFSTIVYAQENPADDPAVKSITDASSNVPVTPEGQIDKQKLTTLKSKAEERIDAINQWLEENASWLKAIFGMVPSVSWMFAYNFLFILFLLALLVLNGNKWLEGAFFSLNSNIQRIIGAILFIILMAIRSNVKISDITMNSIQNIWWRIFMIFMLVSGNIIIYPVLNWLDKRKEKREKAQTDIDRKALHATVKEMTGG